MLTLTGLSKPLSKPELRPILRAKRELLSHPNANSIALQKPHFQLWFFFLQRIRRLCVIRSAIRRKYQVCCRDATKYWPPIPASDFSAYYTKADITKCKVLRRKKSEDRRQPGRRTNVDFICQVLRLFPSKSYIDVQIKRNLRIPEPQHRPRHLKLPPRICHQWSRRNEAKPSSPLGVQDTTWLLKCQQVQTSGHSGKVTQKMKPLWTRVVYVPIMPCGIYWRANEVLRSNERMKQTNCPGQEC